MGKLIVTTAPSGAGKTTITRHLLETFAQEGIQRPPRRHLRRSSLRTVTATLGENCKVSDRAGWAGDLMAQCLRILRFLQTAELVNA